MSPHQKGRARGTSRIRHPPHQGKDKHQTGSGSSESMRDAPEKESAAGKSLLQSIVWVLVLRQFPVHIHLFFLK